MGPIYRVSSIVTTISQRRNGSMRRALSHHREWTDQQFGAAAVQLGGPEV